MSKAELIPMPELLTSRRRDILALSLMSCGVDHVKVRCGLNGSTAVMVPGLKSTLDDEQSMIVCSSRPLFVLM